MIYTLTLNPAIDLALTVPTIAMNSVSRATSSREDAGGKGFNVSRMLNNLGCNNIALGMIAGANGQKLKAMLACEGIATRLLEVEGETRINVSIAQGSEHIKVNDTGPSICQLDLARLTELVSQRAKAGDWWVLAGNLPAGVPTDYYARLVRRLKAAGCKVVVDTSGEALRHALVTQPNVVKPNIDEAKALFGDLPLEQLCQCFIEQGAETVVISLGADGAVFFDGASHDAPNGNAVQKVAAPKITERSAIAAGDSFVAGLVSQLESGQPLKKACQFAAACGTATAAQPGTMLGSMADVEYLLAK
ncbi:1-phosphofructokinase family hexose kinase [Salinibius halmophilus]|uniref:1-phosphofructokinase family hexose kinase n=1 Tax=Salinibius halmophilus TaxID=1853216 RepID=UPI000E65FDE7|nr:1-phosphofructokinase family hexose kinase [Salinibius halmophilus]